MLSTSRKLAVIVAMNTHNLIKDKIQLQIYIIELLNVRQLSDSCICAYHYYINNIVLNSVMN
jgi:hypothetical protein